MCGMNPKRPKVKLTKLQKDMIKRSMHNGNVSMTVHAALPFHNCRVLMYRLFNMKLVAVTGIDSAILIGQGGILGQNTRVVLVKCEGISPLCRNHCDEVQLMCRDCTILYTDDPELLKREPLPVAPPVSEAMKVLFDALDKHKQQIAKTNQLRLQKQMQELADEQKQMLANVRKNNTRLQGLAVLSVLIR